MQTHTCMLSVCQNPFPMFFGFLFIYQVRLNLAA